MGIILKRKNGMGTNNQEGINDEVTIHTAGEIVE
jgi:hypothetical protein